jgi:uncharacterized membrane protein YdjX (TVP38/TMEM64 family)
MNEATTPETAAGASAIKRYASFIQWVSIALIVGSLLLIFRQLPLNDLLRQLESWIKGLGVWGPIVFGLVYILAVVLLVPASALTLVGGGLFGLGEGMVIISLSSTTGADLAFLVSRYLLRQKVTEMARKYPRFDAIDRAISEGGWRIVALLRLSPAVPFNLQNYLYGLTGIRFWPYVLTSWLAMLPGTFLYVYLGYLSKESLQALSGGRSGTVYQWILLVVGLVATVAVTVYITRLARRALQRQTDLAQANDSTSQPEAQASTPAPSGWPWGATIAALLALAALVAAALVTMRPDLISSWTTS